MSNFCITACDLLASIRDQVGDLLGTYTYDDGSTQPAITFNNLFNHVSVSGNEIIILEVPDVVSVFQGSWQREFVYTAYLVRHDEDLKTRELYLRILYELHTMLAAKKITSRSRPSDAINQDAPHEVLNFYFNG
jgi:hypothetical protein